MNQNKEASPELKGQGDANEKKIVFISITVAVLILLGLLLFKTKPTPKLGMEEAREKAENFINDNLMAPGMSATISDISEEYGLYKIMVDVGEMSPIESYISQDGSLFFPQSFEIEKFSNNFDYDDEVTNKQDVLDIELFVMSHCPYGTQMEKALLPVIETLGANNVNFELKFNTHAMHDKVELDEQLTQYCVQKDNKDKLIPYLNCFNLKGNSALCLTENKISQADILNCVQATDKEYGITEKYNDQSTWLSGLYPMFPIHQADNEKYGVQGSPTLIVNGQEIFTPDRNSQALLDLVCTGFNTAPAECQNELPNNTPSLGFGE